MDKDKKNKSCEQTQNKNISRWEPGQSGNPAGRPKVDPEVRARVRDILTAATVDAANMLVATINDPKAKPDLRLRAAEVVLDRVYGKATQPIDGNMDATVQIVLGAAADYAD